MLYDLIVTMIIMICYTYIKVKQDHARSVFVSCTAAIKNDVHIALYILPYAVTQVLQDGSPHDIKEVSYYGNII